MKKAIASTYVLIVFVVTALAQASFASLLPISFSANYDHSAQVLSTTGIFANPCLSNPEIKISPVEENVLVLTVAAEVNFDFCATVIGQAFHIHAGLDELRKQLAAHSIDIYGQYRVVTLDSRFNEIIDFSVQGTSTACPECKSNYELTTQVQPLRVVVPVGY